MKKDTDCFGEGWVPNPEDHMEEASLLPTRVSIGGMQKQ
jgi:hypothetical protein